MKERFRAGLLLGLVLLAFFAPALLPGRLLAPAGDAFSYYYPMRMHAAEIARTDGVPLWSRGIFGGFPLLADVEVGALYPPNLLFLFLSPALAMNLLVVCNYWLAGLATFAYCRSIGASPLGGLVAAFTYMLSGFMVAHLGHVTIIGGAAWLPLLLHRLERLREQPSRRQAAVLALVVALQALGSHPQLVLGSWLLCTAYAVAVAVRQPPAERTRFLLSAGTGAVLGALATAAQWLPTLELVGRSVRSDLTYERFVEFSLPPSHLLGFFFPFLFGTPAATVLTPSWWGHWNETEMSCYAGLSPWFLAPLALGSRRARIWLAIGVVFVVLSLGGHTPLAALLYGMPGYNQFRAPARNLLFVDLSLAILAGLGATRLAAGARLSDLRRAGAPLFIGLLAVYGLLATGSAFTRSLLGVAPERPEAVFTATNPALLLALVVAGVLAVAWWQTARSRRVGYLALGALLLDLGLVGELGFWRTAAPSASAAFERLPAVSALARLDAEVQDYRVLSLIDEQNALLPYGLRDAGGSSSLAPARNVALLGGMDSGAYVFDTQRLFEGRTLDLLGVRYAIVPSEFAAPAAVVASRRVAATRERYEIRLAASPLDEVELELPGVRCSSLSVVAGVDDQALRSGQAILRASIWDASGVRRERTLVTGPGTGAQREASVEASADLGGTIALERLRLTSQLETPLQIQGLRFGAEGGRTLALSSRPTLADARLPSSLRHAEALATGAPASSLTLVSALMRAARVEQGEAVARVTVTGEQGRRIERVLRAGVDTAEWAWDRPDVRFRVRHDRAPVAHSARAGWLFDAHRYRTRLELGERIPVERVALEYLAASAGLDLFELTLEDATTGRSMLLEPDRRRLEPDPPGWSEHAALDLPLAPVRAAALELVTALEDSVLLDEGSAVASVRVDTASGGSLSHLLRAGADTSDWAWERSDVRAQVRHSRAPVYASFPADSGAFEGHWYRTRFDLGGEQIVQGIRIERLTPRAGLVVSAVGLRTAAGSLLPLHQREGPVRIGGTTLPLTLLPGSASRSVELTLPPTQASALVVVSALRHSQALRQGEPVARMSVGCEDGEIQELWLRAGEQTSEWAWADPEVRARVAHRQAPLAQRQTAAEAWGRDYQARLELPRRCRVSVLRLTYVAPEALLSVTGLSLVDAATGLATPVSVAAARLAEPGRWQRRLETAGVSVFENRDALPRAWLVPRVRSLSAPDVLRTIRTGALADGSEFDPRTMALVEDDRDHDHGEPDPDAHVEVVEPSSRRLRVTVRSRSPTFLVLSDSFDPGWQAQVDGQPARLLRANYVQSGLPLMAGEHHVSLSYEPWPFRLGVALSAVALVMLAALGFRKDARQPVAELGTPGSVTD